MSGDGIVLQIYRALRPAPSNEACAAMLSCLYKCVAASAQLPLEVAVDVILTLQVHPLEPCYKKYKFDQTFQSFSSIPVMLLVRF